MGDLKAATAALTALAEHGIPPDVQELLVYGNAATGVRPGALSSAVAAALTAYTKPTPASPEKKE